MALSSGQHGWTSTSETLTHSHPVYRLVMDSSPGKKMIWCGNNYIWLQSCRYNQLSVFINWAVIEMISIVMPTIWQQLYRFVHYCGPVDVFVILYA